MFLFHFQLGSMPVYNEEGNNEEVDRGKSCKIY